ncbi:AIP3-domain-containing protein [Rhodotorula sp. JG-1b]|nr:AIP3-domain-containing protein [Rhodotorula sp. JG-1b]
MSHSAHPKQSSAAGPPSTSHLESTITRLLVATKQLLEGLARWSRREVDENAISEIYVKLGNDFNVACAAFAREGITMNELLSVPADLRVCLETCLSDQPSQATLERHLPQVRQIIIGLLHGLREKQRLYREGVAARRQRDARAAAAAAGNVTQQQQSAAASNLTPTSANRSRDELRRFVTQTQQQQGSGPTASTSSSSMGANEPTGRPPRGDNNESISGAPPTRRSASDHGLPYSSSSLPTATAPPPAAAAASGEARFSSTVQAASLEALRADNLSRRASKRYSAYAIQKMTSPNSTTSSSGGGGGGGGLSPSPSSGSIASFSASDEPDYPCSIFLQIGRNVKKARLSSPPEVASLRQLFVERFGYNPGLGEWPDIYLRDADSGVHYELEEMSEIRAGSVLSLNVDSELHAERTAVEQVKTHIDHGLSSLAQEIKELRATVSAIRLPTTSANALLSPSQRDSAAAAKTESAPPVPAASSEEAAATPAVPESAPGTSVTPVVDMLKSQHAGVQTLRREIGVLRQVYADWTTQTKEMFASVRVQTSHVQHLAKTKLSTDRTFVEAGTARLDSESTDLVVKVDELQDSIEQLRADTVRGVKPRPQTLSETASALRKAVETRQKLSEWLKEVKPTWSQMWSNELGKILGEQKAVEQQETLLGELDEDLEDVAKVFKNIQAVAKQLKTTGLGVKPRERDFGGGNIGNPQEGLSTVLLEVKALSPDPTKRLEAIERAEKQRQAELASRTDEFTEELGDFVGKGRLKKSGGIEETERIRQARSEATLRSMFQS